MFTKMTESCTRRFLQSNIVMEKRKKALTKTANPPSECCHLCNYFFFFLTLKKKQVSMALENRPILIARFAGSR